MKRTLHLRCLLVALLFSSFLSAQVTDLVLLNEDFNGITTGVPVGWTETADHQYTDWGSYLNATYSKGERCLEAFVSGSSTVGDKATLFSPVLTFPASTLTEMMLSFDLLSTSSTDQFSVYVSVDGGATYKPNVVVNNLSPLPEEWTNYNYALDPTLTSAQTNVKIVFEVTSAKSSKRIMLDNVKVLSKPTCKQPIDLNVTQVLQTTATLNWNLHTLGDIPAAYNIIVRDTLTNVNVINQNNVITTGYSMPLTNLTANTTYEVILKGNCEAASLGTSRQTSFIFTTIANAQSLPISQNFSVGTEGSAPSGWILGGANIAECGMSEDEYAGNKGDMSCKISATDKLDAYITSPPVNHAANDLEISFKLFGERNGKFMVGLSSDISDASSTIPIYSDSLSKNEEWEEFVITSFNPYIPATSNMHVVIYAPSGADNDMYVDDIMITEIPTCARPFNITYSDLSSSSITLDWDNFSNQNANDYQIAFMSTTDTTIVDATTHPFTYSALQENTEYKAVVRQICTVGDTSAWSMVLSFKTYCEAITSFPITEGFENSDFPPSCWSQKQTIAGSGSGVDRGDENWIRSTTATNINTGTGSAQLQDTRNGTRTLLVSPPFTTTGVGSHEVNFFLKRDASAKLKEGVKVWVNSTQDTVGGVLLGHVSHSNKGIPLGGPIGFQKYTFPINMAGDVFVVFEGVSEYGTATFIDDIEIRQRPTCIAVINLTQVDVTTTSASFNLEVEEGKASRWIVESKTALDSEYTIDTINSTNFTLSNLTPNTYYEYEIKVRSYCSDVDNSDVKEFNFEFTTPCLAVSLPYEEDFENDFETSRENCWSYPVSYSTYTGYYAHTSFGGVLRASKHNILVSPEITVDSWVGKRISVDASGKNGPLIVGLMSDPNDVTTFVTLDTFIISEQNTTYVVDITTDNAARYIAFENGNSTTYTNYNYYDNVKIGLTPACPDIISASVSDITNNEATLTIEDETNTKWDIKYCSLPYVEANAISISNTTDKVHALNSLAESTQYALIVRSLCSVSDAGNWCDTIYFTTIATPATLPYVCGFEDNAENNAWKVLQNQGVNQFVVGTAPTGVKTGTKGMYVSNDGLAHDYTNNSISVSWATRAFQLEAGVHNISYSVNCKGESTYDFVRVYLAPISTDFGTLTPHKDIDNLDDQPGMIRVDEGKINLLTAWTDYNKTVNIPADGIYTLAFGWKNDGSGGSKPVGAIDDVSFAKLACEPIVNISEISTEDSINLSWNHSSARFVVKVDTEDFNPSEDSTSVFNDTISGSTFAIGGLTPNTVYYYSIQAICDEENSMWSEMKNIKTQCTAFNLPYSENFDGEEISLDCWTSIGMNTPSISTSQKYSGTHSIEFEDGVTVISPELNVTSLVGKQISMYAYSEHDTVNMSIGVMYDVNDISTYEVIEDVEIARPNEWAEMIVNFNILSDPDYSDLANVKNIVITLSEDYDVYFDDIVIEEIPSCPKPRALAIADITDQTANLSWNAGGDETSWRITVIKDEQVVIDSITNTTTMTLSGLSPVSYYTVEARAICSSTDVSGVMRTSFSTICPVAYALPYMETFDYLADNQDAEIYVPCWINDQRTDKSEEWEGYVGTLTPTPCVEYYLYATSTTVDEYSMLETPALDLTSVPTASLEFELMNALGYELYVLISEDAGATFTDTAFFTTDKISDLTLQSVDLSAYVGHQIVIGFNAIKSKVISSGDRYIRIDNVNVFKPSACPAPESLAITDITPNSVTVVVNDTAAVGSFGVAVLPSEEMVNNKTVFTTYNSANITVSNLIPGTAYTIHVRTECSDEPSRHISENFNTECAPVATLPYYEGFERTNLTLICSDTIGTHTVSSTVPEASLTTSSAYVNSGEKALYLKSDEQYLYYVLPEMAAPIDSLALEFWYRNGGSTNIDATIEVGLLPLDLDTTEFIHFYSTTPTNTKTKVQLNIAHLGVKHGYRIAFRSLPYNTTYTKYVSIDDIIVDYCPSCVEPHIVNASNITATSATLTVQDAINSKWQIAWAPIGTALEDYTIIDNVTAPVNISGLKVSTTYTAYARAICASGDTTAWSQAAYFNSECGEILIDENNSYIVKMDNYPIQSVPACWTVMKANAQGNPMITDPLTDEYKYLEIADGACAIALPKFSRPIDQLYMSMRYAALDGPVNDMGTIHIGYTNDLTEEDSIKVMLNSTVAEGWFYNSFYDLTIFPEDAQYLVIMTEDFADFYIDSLNIYAAPDCYRPSYLRNDIVNLSDTSAQLSYKPSPDHVKMEYKLMQGDVVIAEGWTTDNPISLSSNLIPQSEYSFILRSQCNSNGVLDTTIWTDTAYFTTLATPASVPYVHAFENDVENSAWYFESNSLKNNEWVINSDVAAQGSKSMYISNNGSANAYTGDYSNLQNIWAYRTFHLERGVYDLNYLYKGKGSLTYAYMNLYIAPESIDLEYADMNTEGLIEITNKIGTNETWTNMNNKLIINEEGNYNLAFYWYVGKYSTVYNPPAAIDSVRLTKIECPTIMVPDILNISSDSITVALNDVNENPLGYQILVKTNASTPTVAEVQSLAKFSSIDTVGVGNLNDNTAYYAFARVICSSTDTSQWSDGLSFITKCTPDTVRENMPFFEGFEDYSHFDYIGGCWMTEYAPTTTSTSTFRWRANETLTTMNREPLNGDKCLYLYNGKTDMLKRNVYLEAGNQYSFSVWARQNEANTDQVNIALCIENKDGGLDTLINQFITNGDYQMVSGAFTPAVDGAYTMVLVSQMRSTYDYLTIDDLKISTNACKRAENVVLSEITPYSAKLSWESQRDTTIVSISNDEFTFDTIIENDIDIVNTLSFTGLTPVTNYTVTLTDICDGDFSDPNILTFITPCAPIVLPYVEDFQECSTSSLPMCWDNSEGTTTTASYKWSAQTEVGNTTNYTLRFNSYSNTDGNTNKAVSPEWEIPADGNYIMSFRYMNDIGGEFSAFISTDHGATYVDTIFNKVKNVHHWTQVSYSLDKVKGQNASLVLYSKSNHANAAGGYHYIDDIRISCSGGVKDVYDTICAFNAYSGYGFELNSGQTMSSGVSVFERVKYSTSSEECDTTIRLNLYIGEVTNTVIDAQICEGDVYNNGLFVNLTEAQKYYRTYTSIAGCDSIVTLSLTHYETSFYVDTTICEGNSIEFGGRTITNMGEYRDSLVSSNGCDSIITLNVKVAPKHYDFRAIICEGDSYSWEGETYTTTGHYTKAFTNQYGCDSIRTLDLYVTPSQVVIDTTICQGQSIYFDGEMRAATDTYVQTLVNTNGCDSTTTLNLVVAPRDTVPVNDYVCEGQSYYGYDFANIFITSDSVLYKVIKDAEGCESVTELHLTLEEITETSVTVNIEEGETYIFGGNTYSTSGVYDHTFTSSLGCDSIVHLTLNVGHVGVNTVEMQSLVLAPNPIDVLGYATIHRDWTSKEQDGMIMEVLDAVGRLIISTDVTEFPIKVGGIAERGMYQVRITTGTNEVYVSKLIVK